MTREPGPSLTAAANSELGLQGIMRAMAVIGCKVEGQI